MTHTDSLPLFLLDVSIKQSHGIDGLSLTNLKTVNLFTGKNGSEKLSILTSILEAIDEQVIEILGGWNKTIWSRYVGVEELNLERLGSLPETQFPVILLIKNIEMGLHYTEFSSLWIKLIDFAILHSIQLFITTHSYECIESLINVCKHRYPNEDLVRLFRIEKKERYKAYAFTQEQLAAAIESSLEIR